MPLCVASGTHEHHVHDAYPGALLSLCLCRLGSGGPRIDHRLIGAKAACAVSPQNREVAHGDDPG